MLGNIASILSLHEVTTKYMVWYGSRYIGSVAYMAHRWLNNFLFGTAQFSLWAR